MKLDVAYEIKAGARISYNDGRPGHQGLEAIVLAVDSGGMTVQFEDRADTSYIQFLDPRWIDFISIGDGGRAGALACCGDRAEPVGRSVAGEVDFGVT
jgi:hypothetical protein